MFSTSEVPWLHWGCIMSTSGGVQYIGEIPWVHQGGFMSTLGGVQYIGETPWVHQGGFMSTSGGYVGEQGDKVLLIYNENPDVLNMPRCTHDNPPHASWYPHDVLNIPMYSWYPPDVLNTSRCTDALNTPQCTKHPQCTEHTLYRVLKLKLTD